jgi:hypothetical protein
VTIRKKFSIFAGFCFLIVLMVSISACTSNIEKNNSVILPAQYVQTSTVPTSEIIETVTTPVQKELSKNTSDQTIIKNQHTEEPISITVNSAKKVQNFTTSIPMPGHIFLILNVTVKNNDIKDGFSFSWESTNIHDLNRGNVAPHSLNNGANLVKNLENPLKPEIKIKLNDSISGQIIFGIADSTDYSLNLLDNNKTIISTRKVHVEW